MNLAEGESSRYHLCLPVPHGGGPSRVRQTKGCVHPKRCNVRTRTFLLGTRSKRQLRNVFRRFFAPAYTTRRLSVPMKTRTSFFHSHCAYYSRRFSVCQAPFLIFSTAAKSCAFFSSLVTQRRSILVVRFSGRSSAFKTPWRSVALFTPPVRPRDMRSAGVRG